jgi:hypothetical protein
MQPHGLMMTVSQPRLGISTPGYFGTITIGVITAAGFDV